MVTFSTKNVGVEYSRQGKFFSLTAQNDIPTASLGILLFQGFKNNFPDEDIFNKYRI